MAPEPKVTVDDRTAGVRNQDFAATKGIKVTAGRLPEYPPVQQTTFNPVELTQKVADKIKARGARGIIGLGRSFRVMDDNGSQTLTMDEFAKAMRDYRISDDLAEVDAIF